MENQELLRGGGAGRPTFDHSEMYRSSSSGLGDSQGLRVSDGGNYRETMAAGRPTEMKIVAMEPDEGTAIESVKDYKGRIRTWPGIVLLLAMVATGASLIAYGAVQTHDNAEVARAEYQKNVAAGRAISGGDSSSSSDIVSDDGQVGNPKTYPTMGCELPNYLSKNGVIVAQSANGTEVSLNVKGINWFGMETGVRIPFGMWENSNNGTTAYEIASFLSRNNFNSVRLPVCISSVLDNKGPDSGLINLSTNRAINITTYMSTLKTVIKSLAYRHITVLVSLHTLTTTTSGGAWYNDDVTEDQFLEAVDTLTSELCNEDYWNIVGLDLKNEPASCTWGGVAPDWQAGATLIGNRMLKGCPKWLAFVEGIASSQSITLNGTVNTMYDWWGGGLKDAGELPVELDTADKVVYAPHYYDTAVTPAWYFYDGGTVGANSIITGYTELGDYELKYNVEQTMYKMFGYIAENKTNALVLGEFAGLYATDLHPKLTTQRTTDFTIDTMIANGYTGGYMWSLNPESAYQYNPAETLGTFTEGLLEDDWLTANTVFLDGMAAMDALPLLAKFPCFEIETSTSSSGSSSS